MKKNKKCYIVQQFRCRSADGAKGICNDVWHRAILFGLIKLWPLFLRNCPIISGRCEDGDSDGILSAF